MCAVVAEFSKFRLSTREHTGCATLVEANVDGGAMTDAAGWTLTGGRLIELGCGVVEVAEFRFLERGGAMAGRRNESLVA